MRLYFSPFQKKLYILFSISFLIFGSSINLAYLLQLGDMDLVSDYLFTSDIVSLCSKYGLFCYTFTYFVPFEVIANRFIKINFKVFNENCDGSSCPGWWILFLYAPPQKGLAFWKKYLWTSLSLHFHIVLKLLVSF